MTVFVVIIHVVVCLTLIGVILLQAGRGQGLTGSSFGGGNVQSLFGTRGADFLQKATTVAAIGFMLTCLGLDYMEIQRSKSLLETGPVAAPINVEQVQKALEKIKREAAKTGSASAVSEQAAEATHAVSEQAAETAAAVSEQAATAPEAKAPAPEAPKPVPAEE